MNIYSTSTKQQQGFRSGTALTTHSTVTHTRNSLSIPIHSQYDSLLNNSNKSIQDLSEDWTAHDSNDYVISMIESHTSLSIQYHMTVMIRNHIPHKKFSKTLQEQFNNITMMIPYKLQQHINNAVPHGSHDSVPHNMNHSEPHNSNDSVPHFMNNSAPHHKNNSVQQWTLKYHTTWTLNNQWQVQRFILKKLKNFYLTFWKVASEKFVL